MVDIKVKSTGEGEEKYLFEVELLEGVNSTSHKVTLSKNFYESLDTKTPPSVVVRKSFEFLLRRESKESIMSEFDLQLINNFFPEYTSEAGAF